MNFQFYPKYIEETNVYLKNAVSIPKPYSLLFVSSQDWTLVVECVAFRIVYNVETGRKKQREKERERERERGREGEDERQQPLYVTCSRFSIPSRRKASLQRTHEELIPEQLTLSILTTKTLGKVEKERRRRRRGRLKDTLGLSDIQFRLADALPILPVPNSSCFIL